MIHATKKVFFIFMQRLKKTPNHNKQKNPQNPKKMDSSGNNV